MRAGEGKGELRGPKQRPGRVEIDEVLDPENPAGGAVRVVWLSKDELRRDRVHAPAKFWNVRVANECLKNPERIYRHTRPEAEGEWGWCYVSQPQSVFSPDGDLRPLGAGNVFCAYLSPNFDLYEWRREPGDPDDPMRPAGPKTRFGQLVWRK